MMTDRLAHQLAFAAEMDKLKHVLRRTSVVGESRLENTAEHSWHLAVLAPVLAEHAPAGVDVARAMAMLLVHDIVEIDAGDTFAFDATANLDKEDREQAAADRLFGLLPDDQRDHYRALWDEFEERATPESRYANALDRFQGFLQNVQNNGGTWKKYGITRDQILERMDPIREGAPGLWDHLVRTVDQVMAWGG